MQWTLMVFIIAHCGSYGVKSQDRIAPGVPPQHYQQPPAYNHQGQNTYQIPQQGSPQYQVPQKPILDHQIPQHQQQVPQMQQHPQVQNVHHMTNQQVPGEQNHGHHHGHPSQVLNAANIAQETAHIAEHLDVPMDTSKMSEQELQFHYFKMHDADNNNKLDGCELIKSLIHWHEESKEGAGEKTFKDEELITLIDPILDMDDTNKDGFIDYPEFIQAQQKAASGTGRQ